MSDSTPPLSSSSDSVSDEARDARPEGDALAREQARARLGHRLFGEPERTVRLGRFAILERLGEGGMGVVYSAYDPQLDRRVALKLMRGGSDERSRARLLREAQALAQLSHPNVVPVHDVGVLDDLVPPHIDFAVDAPATATVAANPAALRRVLTNLIHNSVESIGADPGSISLSLRRDADATVLEVTDSGAGMTAEAKERMFEPFFTTKPGGRGLGLASLSGMIRSGDVDAQVSSEPGAGTTITLRFKNALGTFPKFTVV